MTEEQDIDFSYTLKTLKTDQLNASDLIDGPRVVTVVNARKGNAEQPVIIDIDGGLKPYKPCMMMRTVIIDSWGPKASQWIGQRMELYRDADVVMGGLKVGGIRINRMTGIDEQRSVTVKLSRGKFGVFKVDPFAVYPEADFQAKLPAMRKAIADGKMTVAQVIERCRKTGELTAAQVEALTAKEGGQ